ncbi:MAG: PAS domain-containing protein, partial [Nitrospinaceae bacterium]
MDNLTETILLNIPNVVLVADTNSKIVFANKAFGELVGQRHQNYIGKSLKETLSTLQENWQFLADEFNQPLK